MLGHQPLSATALASRALLAVASFPRSCAVIVGATTASATAGAVTQPGALGGRMVAPALVGTANCP